MLIQLDGTFILVIISFLVFLFIIKAILYRPIAKVIDERNNFYAKNSKMEFESKEKSKALLKQKEEALKDARSEASKLISQTSVQAKEESENRIKQAKKDVQVKIEEHSNTLLKEHIQTKHDIKPEIANIVNSIAKKVLGRELDLSLEEEKINQYLKI